MNEADAKKAEKISALLKDGFQRYFASEIAKGRPVPSQNDFARWLNVPPTSLSSWINEIRLPVGENIDNIATRLGTEIYAVLDVPARMPKDKLLGLIASRWHKLDDSQKKRIAEMVDNLSFDGAKEPRSSGNPA